MSSKQFWDFKHAPKLEKIFRRRTGGGGWRSSRTRSQSSLRGVKTNRSEKWKVAFKWCNTQWVFTSPAEGLRWAGREVPQSVSNKRWEAGKTPVRSSVSWKSPMTKSISKKQGQVAFPQGNPVLTSSTCSASIVLQSKLYWYDKGC